MTPSRLVLLFASLFTLLLSPAQAQRPIPSPNGAFVILQERHRGGVEQKVKFRNGDTYILAKRAPGPALFEISPNGKWIYRQQRISPGENVGYIYRVDKKGRIHPANETLNDRAIRYLMKKTGFRPDRYFHKNVAFSKWEMKKNRLVFEFHASPIRSREQPVDRWLNYDLETGEVSKRNP